MSILNLAHFRAHESRQYAFFQIPKLLVTDDRYKAVSNDAKLLYGLMLDRMQLSVKNGWLDENDHVFIVYPQQNAATDLNCSVNTMTALYKELNTIGLIVRRRQGQGKPDMIYVMNFASGMEGDPGSPPPEPNDTGFQNPKTCDSRPAASESPESQNLGFKDHKSCDSSLSGDSRTTETGIPESQNLGFKNPKICDSYIRKNKTEYNETDSINQPPAPANGQGEGSGKNEREGTEKKEEKELAIDRDDLIRLSGDIVSPQYAGIMADEVLEAYRLLGQEKDERTQRLLQTVNAATLSGFVREVSQMDLSHIGNLTAYLKRVLADYLRKNSLRGVKPKQQQSGSSYDLAEIQAWLDSGGDLANVNFLNKSGERRRRYAK